MLKRHHGTFYDDENLSLNEANILTSSPMEEITSSQGHNSPATKKARIEGKDSTPREYLMRYLIYILKVSFLGAVRF
jgi:hypothetical protein